MKTAPLILISLLPVLPVLPVHAENKATAQWIPETATATPGQPYRTVIRLILDEGWHTYWENPGEGGLPIKATADLPEGWTLGSILFPAPVHFMTGPLHGFGYAGEILFPITITAPADLKEETAPPPLNATITWLTCNDKACVPGKSLLSLASPDPELVEKAYDALPKPIPGATLTLLPEKETVKISISLPADWKENPTSYKIFPATRNLLAADAKPALTKHPAKENTWTAVAPKNEYFTTLPETATVVLLPPSGSPWILSTSP